MCIILNLLVKDGFYDINVSPDKREVFLKDENLILEKLQEQLSAWFDQM